MARKINKSAGQKRKEPVDVLIKRNIRAGKYVPGQRLVEIDLIREFGVSQRQVRDALRRLESEGLVSIEKNRGATVRRISRAELLCILDVLDSLSLLAVQQAITNISEKNKRIVESSLAASKKFRKQSATEKKVYKYLDENVRFWDSIASVVDNPILWSIRERLETLLFRIRVQGILIDSDPDKWITHHEEILMAILDHNTKLAQQLVLEASADVREVILALSDEVFT